MARRRTQSFRSRFEKEIGYSLTRRGVKWRYEPRKLAYTTTVYRGFCPSCGNSKGVQQSHWYTPDFHLLDQDIYVETKGKLGSPTRMLMLNVIRDNPDVDLRLVFMRDNWIDKKHTAKYSDWCEKHGIKYSIGDIPDAWISER